MDSGEADNSQPTTAIELREGLAISSAHARRAAVDFDPIAAQVVAGSWAMPRSGDSVEFPDGKVRKWESVKAGADGSFSRDVVHSGYLATLFLAREASVMMLEAQGHGSVYVDGEPVRAMFTRPDMFTFRYGWARGENALLFQVGRGNVKARFDQAQGGRVLRYGGYNDSRPQDR